MSRFTGSSGELCSTGGFLFANLSRLRVRTFEQRCVQRRALQTPPRKLLHLKYCTQCFAAQHFRNNTHNRLDSALVCRARNGGQRRRIHQHDTPSRR